MTLRNKDGLVAFMVATRAGHDNIKEKLQPVRQTLLAQMREINTVEHFHEAQDSDVVCFEPMGTDVHGVHAAVMVSEHQGAFPPNTLFRLKKVEAAGTWGSTVEMAVLGGVTAGHHGLLWLGRTA